VFCHYVVGTVTATLRDSFKVITIEASFSVRGAKSDRPSYGSKAVKSADLLRTLVHVKIMRSLLERSAMPAVSQNSPPLLYCASGCGPTAPYETAVRHSY
jgi:hypothetical protein